MPPGATVSLELGAAGRQARSDRLLAIRTEAGAERVLEPPIALRLQPAPAANTARPASRTRHASRPACRSSPVRSVGAATSSGPRIPIRLSVAGLMLTDANGQPTDAARPRQQVPGIAGQPARQITAGALTAEVVGRDGAARLLLQAPAVRLRLEASLDLPAGARLQLALPQGLASPSSGGSRRRPATAPGRG